MNEKDVNRGKPNAENEQKQASSFVLFFSKSVYRKHERRKRYIEYEGKVEPILSLKFPHTKTVMLLFIYPHPARVRGPREVMNYHVTKLFSLSKILIAEKDIKLSQRKIFIFVYKVKIARGEVMKMRTRRIVVYYRECPVCCRNCCRSYRHGDSRQKDNTEKKEMPKRSLGETLLFTVGMLTFVYVVLRVVM